MIIALLVLRNVIPLSLVMTHFSASMLKSSSRGKPSSSPLTVSFLFNPTPEAREGEGCLGFNVFVQLYVKWSATGGYWRSRLLASLLLRSLTCYQSQWQEWVNHFLFQCPTQDLEACKLSMYLSGTVASRFLVVLRLPRVCLVRNSKICRHHNNCHKGKGLLHPTFIHSLQDVLGHALR